VGLLGSMTPRMPLQMVRASASGHQMGSTPMGSRERSVSAGPMPTAAMPTGPGQQRQVVAAPMTQYGNRFSPVAAPTSGAASVPYAPLRASSRMNTPLTLHDHQAAAAFGVGRFVPVTAAGYMEVQRGRDLSQGPQRAPSVSTRAGSPPPSVSVAPANAVVRQSSVARQVSAPPSALVGSCTPTAGLSVSTTGGGASCVTSAGYGEESPCVPLTLAGRPNNVGAQMAAVIAASAVRGGPPNTRHSLGPHPSGAMSPQPSRYAYVNAGMREAPVVRGRGRT